MWPKPSAWKRFSSLGSVILLSALPSLAVAQSRKDELRPWDMLKDPAYQKAHRAMLGSKSHLPWIARLECTAGPGDVRQTKVSGEDWVLIRCCKPHWCSDFLVVLYSSNRGVAYGTYRKDDTQHYLGRPPKDVKSVLDEYDRNGY